MKQRLSTFTPIQIHSVGAFIAVGAVAISCYAVYSSWQSRQTGIESSKHELTQISSELSTSQRERGRLQSQIATLQSDLHNHQSIDQPSKINDLATRVVTLAESHNLSLEQFEPEPPIESNGNRVQPISIMLTAPYQSITNWLDQLHSDMPDIHVEGISIRSQSPADPTVKSDIRLKWYIPTNAESSQ